MNFSKIEDDYLFDIIKVFLFGIRTDLRDEDGNSIPDIIVRYYHKNDPRYFPYIVEWDQIIRIRNTLLKQLKESTDIKLNILAKAIKLICEKIN